MNPARLAALSVALLAGCVAPPPGPPVRSAEIAVPVYRPVPDPVGFVGPVRNPMIRDIQRQLRRHGYYPGPTDGINSPQTAGAIQAFQASHHMPPDGVASPGLLRALRAIPPGA